MAEQIISASGAQFGLIITPEGAIPISGIISVTVGSESVITAGSVEVYQATATDLNIDLGNTTPGSVIISGALLGSFAVTTVPVPISGFISLAESAVGSVVISGGLLGSFAVTTNPVPISGNVISQGYATQEIIRKDAGSPSIDYEFTAIVQSVSIDNLGSAPVYFAFAADANPANSGTGFIDAFEYRSFDVQIGSIGIQSSGITSSEVQVIGIF